MVIKFLDAESELNQKGKCNYGNIVYIYISDASKALFLSISIYFTFICTLILPARMREWSVWFVRGHKLHERLFCCMFTGWKAI